MSIVRARTKSKKRWVGKNNGKPFSRNGRSKLIATLTDEDKKQTNEWDAKGIKYTITPVKSYLLKRTK